MLSAVALRELIDVSIYSTIRYKCMHILLSDTVVRMTAPSTYQDCEKRPREQTYKHVLLHCAEMRLWQLWRRRGRARKGVAIHAGGLAGGKERGCGAESYDGGGASDWCSVPCGWAMTPNPPTTAGLQQQLGSLPCRLRGDPAPPRRYKIA